MQSWSIIIFFHNEENNIEKVCRQAISFLGLLKENKKEIIFINDGCTDNTCERIQKITGNKPYIKFVNHQKKIRYRSLFKIRI